MEMPAILEGPITPNKEGPDSPHFRTLVPKTVPGMVFGTSAIN